MFHIHIPNGYRFTTSAVATKIVSPFLIGHTSRHADISSSFYQHILYTVVTVSFMILKSFNTHSQNIRIT
jgi:hypothetical protein